MSEFQKWSVDEFGSGVNVEKPLAHTRNVMRKWGRGRIGKACGDWGKFQEVCILSCRNRSPAGKRHSQIFCTLVSGWTES